MHLDQADMPLALLTERLGHADPETTLIYAHADTEMKRQTCVSSLEGDGISSTAAGWPVIRSRCGADHARST